MPQESYHKGATGRLVRWEILAMVTTTADCKLHNESVQDILLLAWQSVLQHSSFAICSYGHMVPQLHTPALA